MRRHRSRILPAVRRSAALRPLVEPVEDRVLMAVITVTGVGDAISATDGVVTLREAITAANSNKNVSDVVGVGAYGADTIAFNIPGAGVHTIAPTSPLPRISDPVTIDGYTQPGSAPNTNPVGQGLNGTLLIEIDGENAGDVRFGMIYIEADNCTVRGLVINRTQGVKIGIQATDLPAQTGQFNRIEGNYIGTDATGTMSFPPPPAGSVDRVYGVSMETVGNTIGGTTPAARNLISGNTFGSSSTTGAYGIRANGSSLINNFDTLVQGNLIGTDRTGTRALGNGSGGVLGVIPTLNAGRVIVGGPEAGAGNLISGNGGDGVDSRNGVVQGNFIGTDVTGTLPLGNGNGANVSGNVTLAQNLIEFNASQGVIASVIASTGNRITQNTIAFNGFRGVSDSGGDFLSRNAIFSNGGSELVLGGRNDASPDADGIQNYPILGSVVATGPGTRVTGVLDSKPSANFRIEFFANSDRDENPPFFGAQPGEFGGGRTFLGMLDVTTDANGHASFTADLPALPAGQPFVTATATDITDTGSGPRNNTSGFSPVAVLGGPSFVVTNTGDTGLGTLREAIISANLTPGAQTITFAIPATDARHFYYRNDGVTGQVSRADVVATTAASDATIADIDPDWPFSWYSIQPGRNLPQLIGTTTIDGYSQPGSVANTLPALGPLNTVLRIELDGTNAPGIGLYVGIGVAPLDASNSRIDGLAINRFGGDGIQVDTLNGHVTIAGNFIGTDVSGTIDLGNRGTGVFINTENFDRIGGTEPSDRNLITGNNLAGIEMLSTSGTLIRGNRIGAARSGGSIIGNGGTAIRFDTDLSDPTRSARSSTPGGGLRASQLNPGIDLSEENELSENQIELGLEKGELIRVRSFDDSHGNHYALYDTGDRYYYGPDLTENPEAANRFVGQPTVIDIGDDGVTPNDLGDLDGIQNYPVLASAETIDGQTTIRGSLNSLANSSFELQFYSSQALIPSGHGPGEQPLGTLNVKTDAHGNASFTFPSPVLVSVGHFITALASGLAAGTLAPMETSEFSAGIAVTAVLAQPTANLSVSQSTTTNPARVGGDLVFTLIVSNAGPDPAAGARLVVTSPPGATFVAATGGIVPVGGTLTFDLGTLANGASATVHVIVRPVAPGALVSTATVTSSTPDPATADNATATTVTVLPPPDTVGPTVSNVQLPDPTAKTTPLVLTFSEDLDPARAANLANYRLVMAGRDKKFGTKDDKVIALLAATYNPIAHTVTLVPRKKLTISVPYRLTVDGTSTGGVTDRAGNLLDGDRDGRVSGNYIAAFKLVRPKRGRRH